MDELEQYSEKVAQKPRWLVFNKVDLLPAEEVDAKIQEIVEALGWEGEEAEFGEVTRTNACHEKGNKSKEIGDH